MRFMPLLIISASTAAFAGCASQPTETAVPVSSTQGTTLVRIGYVTDVRDIAVYEDRLSSFGSLVGALVGGIAGNSIGSGYGQTIATVAGAAAGGIAGQHIVKANSSKSLTALTVRFDNGDVHTYDIESSEVFRVGDQVKIITNGSNITITH